MYPVLEERPWKIALLHVALQGSVERHAAVQDDVGQVAVLQSMKDIVQRRRIDGPHVTVAAAARLEVPEAELRVHLGHVQVAGEAGKASVETIGVEGGSAQVLGQHPGHEGLAHAALGVHHDMEAPRNRAELPIACVTRWIAPFAHDWVLECGPARACAAGVPVWLPVPGQWAAGPPHAMTLPASGGFGLPGLVPCPVMPGPRGASRWELHRRVDRHNEQSPASVSPSHIYEPAAVRGLPDHAHHVREDGGPRGGRSASAARRSRTGIPDMCAWTPCTRETATA